MPTQPYGQPTTNYNIDGNFNNAIQTNQYQQNPMVIGIPSNPPNQPLDEKSNNKLYM